MSSCHRYQQDIAEGVALSGRDAAWDVELSAHLDGCAACREVLEQELELNTLLSEPVPLPPADLIPGVMARIAANSLEPVPASPVRESSLPWAERFAWAASGAVAMFCLERLPDLSADWLAETQEMLSGALSTLSIPLEVNTLYLAAMALALLALQGLMVHQVRTSAT